MANFIQESKVKYACSCGILNPLNKLFFCRHCSKMRCGFCVCHEVDSHFCSNCLENIPSTEARHKKNCCANCFDCPCCHHTLSARATTIIKKDETPKEGEGDGKIVTKKVYYLSCLSCRWTSRDAGLPDQSVATGGWSDKECLYQERYNSLLDYYQAVVLHDKQEKLEYLRRKAPKTHKYPSLTDRTGLTVSMIRRQIGWSDKTSQKLKPIHVGSAKATEEVDDLPDYIFTQKVNLRNVTTILQRHGQPSRQPFTVNKLYPQRRFLWIKRSLRCRQCEHNVIKPEYHPTSVKYRIQLFANYHVPDVLFVRCEKNLIAGEQCSVILKLSNPTMHDMQITITNLPTLEEELNMIEEFKKACSVKDVLPTADSLKSLSGTNTNLTRQTSVTEYPRVVREKTNSIIQPLENSFKLNHRDDSTEFDEDEQKKDEANKFITWRRANKVSIRLNFTPDSNLNTGDEVSIGFSMNYSYVNTVTNTPEKKEPTPQYLVSRIFVKVGTIE